MAFRFPLFKSKNAPPAPAMPPPVPGTVPVAEPPSAPSPLVAPGEPAPSVELPSSVELAVADILPLLPPHVLKESVSTEGMPSVISISTADILPQLATGKVQVSLDALISTFPEAMVDASVAGSGHIKIKIPLHLIAPKLSASASSPPAPQIHPQVDASMGAPSSEQKVHPEPSAPPVVKPPSLPPHLPRLSIPAPKIPSPAETMAAPLQASPIHRPPSIPAPATPPAMPPPLGMPSVPPIKLRPPTLPPAMASGAAIPSPGPALVPATTLPALPTSSPTPSSAPVAPPAAVDEDAPTVVVPPIHPSEAASVDTTPPSPPPLPKPPAPVPEIPAPSFPTTPPAATPHPKQTAALREILGIAEETPLHLQDLTDKILRKLEIQGVLIVAQDGRRLAGSLPPELDLPGWSRLASQLFQKFDGEDKALPPGRPRHCFLEVGGHGFSFWNESGICLVLCHHPEEIGPEFGEHGDRLAREVALFCQRHGTTDG